jgi:hypothetical protein
MGAAQHELTRHGHRKLARFGQMIDAGVLAHTVLDNYHWNTKPVVGGAIVGLSPTPWSKTRGALVPSDAETNRAGPD